MFCGGIGWFVRSSYAFDEEYPVRTEGPDRTVFGVKTINDTTPARLSSNSWFGEEMNYLIQDSQF